MVNRLLNLLHEKEVLKKKIGLGDKLPASRLAGLAINLKQVVARIKNFGQKHEIVMVTCLYVDIEGDKKTMQVYFTGIEEYEALDYVKFRLDGEILQISAHKIPVGKPIKI